MEITTKGRLALLGRGMLASAIALLLLAGVAGASQSAPTGLETAVVGSLPLPASANGHPGVPSSVAASCLDVPRSEVDRPDTVAGPSIHVVYLVAADSPDQLLDIDGTLNCTIQAQNEWMLEQSGLRWNFDTFSYAHTKNGRKKVTEAIDVTFVRSGLPAAELGGASQVRDELVRLGFAQPGKRYLTYVMAKYTTFCGDAIYPISGYSDDDRPDGIYAQVYLSAANACNAQWFGRPGNASWSDAIAQQELLHAEGLAAIGAPRSCPMVLPFAHICTAALFYTEESFDLDPERVDLMYPYVSLPLSEKVLDRGNDDYFDHRLPIRDLIDSPYLVPERGIPESPRSLARCYFHSHKQGKQGARGMSKLWVSTGIC